MVAGKASVGSLGCSVSNLVSLTVLSYVCSQSWLWDRKQIVCPPRPPNPSFCATVDESLVAELHQKQAWWSPHFRLWT